MENSAKTAIEKMGIYELRTLARNVGVPSPTTLKRQELLEQISEILEGKKKAVPVKKIGRPPKKINLDSSVLDVYIPQDFVDYANAQKENRYNQEFLVFEHELDNMGFKEKVRVSRKGVLRKTKGGALFFKDDKNVVFFPSNLAIECQVLEGDMVEGEAWEIFGKPFDIFFNVQSINGMPYVGEPRNLCSFTDIVESNNEPEGSRKYINFSDTKGFVSEISEVLDEYKKNGYIVNVLAAGLMPDKLLLIKKHLGADRFVSYYEDGPQNSYETILDAINNSIVLARSGKKVVLFVYDLSDVISELDMFFSASEQAKRLDYNTMLIVRKIVSSNRCLSNGGSLTTIIGTSEPLAPGCE